MKKRNKILFIVSLVVLIAAVASIVIYLVSRNSKLKVYDELASIAHDTEETTEQIQQSDGTQAAQDTKPVAATREDTNKQGSKTTIDFEALQKYNQDIYAWITIPDTEIDYPILHKTTGDPDYYLNNTAEGTAGLPGSIYTQYNHNQDLDKDPVTFIYGHRTYYGGMFGQLGDYFDEEFRSKHSELHIYTPEHTYTYKVAFAVTFGNDHLLDRFNDCSSEEDYQGLIDAIRTERLLPSWFSDSVDIDTDDHMVVLSTCNIDYTQRVLIGAVRTDEE